MERKPTAADIFAAAADGVFAGVVVISAAIALLTRDVAFAVLAIVCGIVLYGRNHG